MALTLEQFSALRKKGLSAEQIAKFESEGGKSKQTEEPQTKPTATTATTTKQDGIRNTMRKMLAPSRQEMEAKLGQKLPQRDILQDLLGLATGVTGGLVQSGLEMATPLENLPRGSMGGQVVGTLLPGGVVGRGAGAMFRAAGGMTKPIRAAMASGAVGGALFPQGASQDTTHELLKRGGGAAVGAVVGGASIPVLRAGQAISNAVMSGGVNALSRFPSIANKASQSIPGVRKLIETQANKAQLEAEKLTAQVLQPGGKEAIGDIMARRKLPAVEQGARAIKEVKTYDDLVGVLKDTTEKAMGERNRILAQYNAPIDTAKSHGEFMKFVSDRRNFGQLKRSELGQYDEVFANEAKFLKQNPTMDIIQAQARKEALQDLTKPLLEKQARSGLQGNEPARLQALNEVRKFYKNIITDTLPKRQSQRVIELNSQYEGLRDASELASSMALGELNEVPKTLWQRVASSFGLSPEFTAGRIVVKKLAEVKHLRQTTREIQDMSARSELLRKLITSSRKANPKP